MNQEYVGFVQSYGVSLEGSREPKKVSAQIKVVSEKE